MRRPARGPRHRACRILALGVEDPRVIQALIDDGHSVVARSHPSALFGAGNVPWHVIVADLGASLSGAAEVLGAGRRWRVPVVLIADHEGPLGPGGYGAQGAFAVVTRPFDLDDLRTIVLMLVHAFEARTEPVSAL